MNWSSMTDIRGEESQQSIQTHLRQSSKTSFIEGLCSLPGVWSKESNPQAVQISKYMLEEKPTRGAEVD